MQWYVRSAGHTDAHYGALVMDGMVLAVCGLSFWPQPQLFGNGPAVLAPPVNPARCCLRCVTVEQHTRHDDAALVADLIETLGGGDLW